MIAATPKPPYFAMIITSKRNAARKGFEEVRQQSLKLALSRPGFLGLETANEDISVGVSYWSSMEAIKAWRQDVEKFFGETGGMEYWFHCYSIRICRVEKAYYYQA